MFKLDSILGRQRTAGGWRNEGGILSDTHGTAIIYSLMDAERVVSSIIRYTRVLSVEYST